jgi:hypothetical protein
MFKRILAVVAILFLVCAVVHLASHPASAEAASHHGTSTSFSGPGPITDCSQLKVKIDDEEAVRGEARLTIPRTAGSTVSVIAAENGGVQVQGWSRNEFAVTACKAVRQGSPALLDRISVSFENGRLSVSGPSDRDEWLVYLLIQAPYDAAMNLEALNGPIDLYETAGRLDVRTENGPIGMKRCSGDLDVHAENGPISIAGSKGNVRIRTQNGPISVNLMGNSWESGELRADAINGPLNVVVPRDYKSGVLIETSNHSPVHCRADACSQAMRTWDDDHRRIEFGKSFVVRMSTVNGPVSIESHSSDF